MKNTRAADRWLDWLGISGTYTGPETYLTTLRVDTSGLTANVLWKLKKKLAVRSDGQDLGIVALRPRDSFGNLLGGPNEAT